MTSRRIHKLHLTAPNEAIIGRGAILVEDAFHTASLPNHGGRLLIVRSLSLGRIRSNQSSAAVALAIEERLRLLDSTAVYAEDPSSPWRPVVYFHNDAEPYILLAARLARCRNTDAWFWPLAVSCFRHDMSPDEALRALVFEAAKIEAGVATVAAIVRGLVEREDADRLCESFRWQDGLQLLRSIGCSLVQPRIAHLDALSSESRFVVEIPGRWLVLLDRWASRWGAGDARTLWLAALALIAEKPSRAHDPRLSQRATRVISEAVKREVLVEQSNAKRGAMSKALGVAELNKPASPQQPGRPLLSEPAISANETAISTPETTISTPYEGLGACVARIEPQPPTPASRDALPSVIKSSEDGPALRFTRYAGLFFLLRVMARLSIEALLEGNQERDLTAETQRTRRLRREERDLTAETQRTRRLRREERDLTAETQRTRRLRREERDLTAETQRTRRLRSEERELTAETQTGRREDPSAPPLRSLRLCGEPALIECDLPARLLLRVAAQLDIPPEEPIMVQLQSMCSEATPEILEFVQPERWRQGICNRGALVLRRVEASRSERVLFDGSGRLALALWRDRAPTAVRHFARETPVRRGAVIGRRDGMDLLLDSWLTAMRRWCRKYARLGLRELVCRPGRVSITRTHIDAVFDHRHADIRVRKAGLDLDPGWIPWFGRVVSFHYQYGEYFDG